MLWHGRPRWLLAPRGVPALLRQPASNAGPVFQCARRPAPTLAAPTIGCSYLFVTPTAAHQAPGTPSARPLPLSEPQGRFHTVLVFLVFCVQCLWPSARRLLPWFFWLCLCHCSSSCPGVVLFICIICSLLIGLHSYGLPQVLQLYRFVICPICSSPLPTTTSCSAGNSRSWLVTTGMQRPLLDSTTGLLPAPAQQADASLVCYLYLRSVDPRMQRHGRHLGLPRSHLSPRAQ